MSPTAPPPTGARPPRPASALPCVIDVEASGFGRGSFPIEIGYVLPDGQAFCTLIRPPAHWTHWDGRAEALHGLSRAKLARHGRPPVEVARLLNDKLAGRAIYCDGWAYDYTWLALLFDEAGFSPAFQLRHLHELLGDHDAACWDAACAEARRSLALGRHRASNDARVLQLALGHLGVRCPAQPSTSPANHLTQPDKGAPTDPATD